MNPLLASLHPYPFERLKQLFASVTPNAAYRHISLGIGEPRHATPQVVLDALARSDPRTGGVSSDGGLTRFASGMRRMGRATLRRAASIRRRRYCRSTVRAKPCLLSRKPSSIPRRQRHRHLPESVLSNLRRRRFARRRKTVLRAERSVAKLQHQLGRNPRRRSGPARNWFMSARPEIPPAP